MPSYTAITDATLTAGRAITQTLLRTFRDNADYLKNATDGLTNNVVLNNSPAEPQTTATSFTTVTKNRVWLEAGTYTFRSHAELMIPGGNGTTDTASVRIRADGTAVLDTSTTASAAFAALDGTQTGVAVAASGWKDVEVQLKTTTAAHAAVHRHVTVSWLKTA